MASVETASAVLRIDMSAIVRNYQTLRKRVAPARCAAVVKADAYGLGADEIATQLMDAGCEDFFVAVLAEAISLRATLGPRPRIYVLNGLAAGAETEALKLGILPVLNTLEQCRAWTSACESAPAVLQVDTGMTRLGLSTHEQQGLIADTALRDRLDLVMIMSHLANADDPTHDANGLQHAAFLVARRLFPGIPGSLANSAGIFLSPDFHLDLCRPGAALYGIETGPNTQGIEPVVSLDGRIAQLRNIEPGTSIGYGYQFTAERPMRLATISVGYADGWPRSLSNTGAAWFDEQRLPILGRVSMDSFVIDVSAVAEGKLTLGTMVELIGPHQSVDDVARAAGTIGYEILTSLGGRYHRIYSPAARSAS